MSENRKKLSQTDQEVVLERIMKFREIHGEILDLEAKLKEMQERKEMLLTDLQLARADEEMMMAEMTSKYGIGRLDVRTMEWVEQDNKKTDTNEYIERI